MFEHLGIAPADILLPNCNLSKWSVIACDQFTAQADYWRRVDEIVGGAPSSLRLILPEAYLHEVDARRYIAQINETMRTYLDQHLFYTCPESMIYVEREVCGGGCRRGLVCRIDLEEYDYAPGSRARIRATEQTVTDRIPFRVEVRKDAAIELPHIMILMDDGACPLIAPLAERKEAMEKLYGFSLMEGGGRIDGWRVDAASLEKMDTALRRLKASGEMLFAVGDGNHSLAAAKAIYEEEKKRTPAEQWEALPSRWALAEIISLNDPAVRFLPIHRVVFGVDGEQMLAAFRAYYPGAVEGEGEGHVIRWCCRGRAGAFTVPSPRKELAVETLQDFIDDYICRCGGTVDYIHELETVQEMSCQTRAIGFLLPDFPREKLFPYVQANGALPRKTFSIGHSRDKRYYLEARELKR